MTEQSSILPCPFCGTASVLWDDYPTDNSRKKEYKVFCDNHDCSVAPETPYFIFPSDAIRAWNSRKSS